MKIMQKANMDWHFYKINDEFKANEFLFYQLKDK